MLLGFLSLPCSRFFFYYPNSSHGELNNVLRNTVLFSGQRGKTMVTHCSSYGTK